jgi:hypothetical protein
MRKIWVEFNNIGWIFIHSKQKISLNQSYQQGFENFF